MNMVHASICLCLPSFLSSVLCSALSTGLLPPWLDLFLSTLFFLLYIKRHIFPDYCFCCFIVGVQKSFDFWILTLYPTVLSNSLIRSSSFLVESIGFSMYTTMSSATMTVWLHPFQFGCLLFLFLVWLLWLGLPILCWIGVVRESILVLFLILVGKL